MPEDIRISELSNVSSLGNNDLIEVSQVNAQSETGYDSKKATLINVGDRVCNGIEYANALYTSNKKIIGAINELTTYIPVWNNTASGAIATFDTSLALPLQDCTIEINAVQESGTPTPSSPKAISGFTGANIYNKGVNLWDEVYRNGYYNNSGAFVSQGSTVCNTNPIVVDGGMQLYIHSGSYHISLFFYDVNGNYLSNLYHKENTVITVPASAKTMNWTADYGEGSTYNNDISINYPATDTAYHAYNANTTAITWQDEVGTVYGGTLDVTSGVLTVTHGFKDLGTLTYQRYQASGVYYFRSYDITDIKPATAPNPANILCECYDIKTSSTLDEDCIAVANGQKIIYIRDDTYTSENALQTALSGMLLVYELETPVTYQLTPTQISAIVGTNNVFTDTNGNTSVVYACSLKDYID